jgi:co-chaperonin GroES (HSP10)
MTLQIIPVRNNIIFEFVEDSTSTRFVNSTKSGIMISSQDSNQTGIPRWGKITHVGPDVKNVKVGEYALIEPGKWTSSFYVDNHRYWKTDDDQIMCTSDEPTTTY